MHRKLPLWLLLTLPLVLSVAACGGGSSDDDDDDDVTGNDDDDITTADDDDDDTTGDDDDDFPTDFWSEDVLELCDLIGSNEQLDAADAEQLAGLCVDAARAYSGGEHCKAAGLLEDLIAALESHANLLGTQDVQGLTIPAARHRYFLAMDKGLPDTCPSTARIGKEAELDADSIEKRLIKGKAAFGEPLPQLILNGGITYTGLEYVGTMPSTETGLPSLPTIQHLVAIPLGATSELVCTPDPPKARIGMLLPAVQKVRDAAALPDTVYAGETPPDRSYYRESPPMPDPEV